LEDEKYNAVTANPCVGMEGTGQADAGSDVIGGKLYLVGGYGLTDGDPLQSVCVYSTADDSWKASQPYPVKTWGLGSAAIGTTLYAFGGRGAGVKAYSLEVDGNEGWKPIQDMPPQYRDSQGHVALADPQNNRIFIMGSSSNHGAAKDTHVYWLKENRYETRAEKPHPNAWFTTAIHNDRIYTIGGFSASIVARMGRAHNRVCEYDVSKDKWVEKPVVIPGPARYGMIRNPGVHNGRVPVVDGYSSGPAFYNYTHFFDLESEIFTDGPRTLMPRDGVAGGIIDGKLYIAGGRNVPDGEGRQLKGIAFCERLNLG
jgi:N-acetylneuraminic acid mutarotase